MTDIKKPDLDWRHSVETIIGMGQYLTKLKEQHSRDDIARMMKIDYNLGSASIDRLVNVAKHPILSNPENFDKLPNGWGTLYELRLLPDEILIEKMRDGSLKNINKYKIWEMRGVKTKDGPHLGKNEGARVRVPDNTSLVAYVAAGMQREEEFENDIEAVARMLGIGAWTYRQVRAIVLLSRHPDLSNADSEMVHGLIDKINKTRNVQSYYLKAKPLIERIWGTSRNKKFTGKNHAKRVENYLNSIFILGMSAQKMADLERPYMSVEDTDKAIGDLSEIGTTVRKIAEALRRSKNE